MKKIILIISCIVFAGLQLSAQSPSVTVRFNNPVYDCATQKYCVDVEFTSAPSGYNLFGMNIRFFYDDNVLEYISMESFEQGYSSLGDPEILNFGPGSGLLLGIPGPLEWVNGSIQLTGETSIELSGNWTKLFQVCFHVDDPNALNKADFCPSIVWDLEANPLDGGFLPADDGVVMTVVNPNNQQLTIAAIPNVVQFNWEYLLESEIFGYPVSIICISTVCGTVIPVSDWSLALAIGLMLITTIIIWRRRA
jgi:hypothetical protein